MPLEQLVLASGNSGKLKELAHLLEPLHMRVCSQADFDVTPPEETGLSFVENALIKAREAARVSGLPALGDDSGLVVDALDGAPGIYSARFAGASASDADNNQLLLERLAGLPLERRSAHFHCCLVMLRSAEDPAPLIATGTWHGQILEAARGQGGFGYDPLFLDPKLGVTAAELTMTEKARISHRGQALNALIERIREA
ncbi:MAG: RdgB/HAM1 family non-canonical purine NTP pyrophosphatase [Wenzhouxiangella sp.]|nr:RdgB/HAM1 family non-canonical purine NTP pyrophosphatase [Wenzhouxiangella sp.]MCH8478333.1 RdgB/HAM1 family non-canonical purine NTP pyrophosphatase [Wenzhouxiangella sp.]